MHDIRIGPDGIFTVTLTGFLDVAEVEEYQRAVQDMVSAATGDRGGHLLLVDARDCGIQSQEVVAAFSHVIRQSRLRARLIAVVVPRTLARRQTLRVVDRTQARIFEDRASATAWLRMSRERAA